MAGKQYDSLDKVRKDSDLAITMVPTGAVFQTEQIAEVSSFARSVSITTVASPAIPMYITVPGFTKSTNFAKFNDVSGIGQSLTFMMLVNPESFNVGKTGTTQSHYTRKGYITQLWGINQDTISATGKTAAFYMGRIGLSNDMRKYSVGLLNFMALFNAYRNNGYRLIDRTQIKNFQEITRVIDVIHGIQIDYDGNVFMGHFSNFTLDEDAEHPFLLNYNFEFIVSTYGASSENGGNVNEIYGHYLKPEDELWNRRYSARLLSDLTTQKWAPTDMFIDPVVTIPDDTRRFSTVPLDEYNAKIKTTAATGPAITSSAYSHAVRKDLHEGDYGLGKGEKVAIDIGNLGPDYKPVGFVNAPFGGLITNIGEDSITVKDPSTGNSFTYAHVTNNQLDSLRIQYQQSGGKVTFPKGSKIYYDIDHIHIQTTSISGYDLEQQVKNMGIGYRDTVPTERVQKTKPVT